jgi:hypothetical protein
MECKVLLAVKLLPCSLNFRERLKTSIGRKGREEGPGDFSLRIRALRKAQTPISPSPQPRFHSIHPPLSRPPPEVNICTRRWRGWRRSGRCESSSVEMRRLIWIWNWISALKSLLYILWAERAPSLSWYLKGLHPLLEIYEEKIRKILK